MLVLLEALDRLAADALRRRVRRSQLRVLALDRTQLVEERVVFVVSDQLIVEDVVGMVVASDQLA